MKTALTSLARKTCLHPASNVTCPPQALSLYMHTLTTAAPPSDVFTANNNINLHAKRGDFHLAHQLFGQMPHRNIFSWSILVSGYAQHGKLEQSFRLFSQMLSHFTPNDFVYASLLPVCDYPHGMQLHGVAFKTGFVPWIYVANALIAMYWKNSNVMEAQKVFEEMNFRNLVTYNSMIKGLVQHENGYEAMTLFTRMLRDGVGFDRTTLLTLASSQSEGGDKKVLGLNFCLQLHCSAIKTGLVMDIGVVTSLIKGYSIFPAEIVACHRLFSETSGRYRDVVLWTGIMTASAEKDPEQVLVLFNQMRKEEDFYLDRYVLTALLKACANMVTEKTASSVHCQVLVSGFVNALELDNALVHAYARCGSIDNAEQVFTEMCSRDIVSWNSMLMAFAVHGKAEEALNSFKRMDVAPDESTFVALLSSCSHAGMVKEGTEIFDTMLEKYEIVPQLDHYACMIDILGRAGHLSEAQNIIMEMPMKPDYVIWSAFLGACRKHGDMNRANLASSKLKELDPENSLGYVMISNIYCTANSFNEGGFIRAKMDKAGVRKEPGLSWTEVGHRVHEFASGGHRQPQLKEIRAYIGELLIKLKNIGYVPDTSSVLFDVQEEHKEEQLHHHSEKLALVFSLMHDGNSSRGGDAIKIMKNIRICLDCHNFMRFASKLVEKVIIVRDAKRFHHFKEGACSCNDYW
ncbi:hypothetical protein ACS0TY_029119 [Phlomoides rotata]